MCIRDSSNCDESAGEFVVGTRCVIRLSRSGQREQQSFAPVYLFPVSYTHLDVYKRQDQDGTVYNPDDPMTNPSSMKNGSGYKTVDKAVVAADLSLIHIFSVCTSVR